MNKKTNWKRSRSFTEQLDEKVARFDVDVASLEDTLKPLADDEEIKTKQQEYQDQEEELWRRMEQEKWLEEMQFEMRKQLEKKEDRKTGESSKVKLPKLMISKCDDTPLEWSRFRKLFETDIDKQVQIIIVAKFSYLTDFLFPHVPKLIVGFPFTFEGYSRAIIKLQSKSG